MNETNINWPKIQPIFFPFSIDLQNLPLADKLVKEDIDNTLECLQMFDKQYTDIKTYYDILLYQTNNGWRCAIDVGLDVSTFSI